MSVSLDEQRYSRVHGDGEPDFIELPALPPASRRLRRSIGSRPTRRHDRAESHEPDQPKPVRVRLESRPDGSRQRHARREPRWKRILVSLITFERSTGYAISIIVHVSLIVILSLFMIGGSRPTPQIMIDSTFVEELPSVGEVLTLEQTLPDSPVARIPVLGDVASADGDGLGRFFGEGGAEFFGLRDAGRDFVYIVDCSGSMQGEPIARARRELLDSIRELKTDQRFYVMFYADSPFLMFNESGPPREFISATADNKDRVRDWVERIDADGGTEPEQALKWALGLNPDAVFLLTDGRFGDITNDITTANGGASRIHTIAFMNSAGEEQLRRMADENGGTYRFVP